MLIWIKRILMLLGLYFVLSQLGLWDTVVDWFWSAESIVAAVVGYN